MEIVIASTKKLQNQLDHEKERENHQEEKAEQERKNNERLTQELHKAYNEIKSSKDRLTGSWKQTMRYIKQNIWE